MDKWKSILFLGLDGVLHRKGAEIEQRLSAAPLLVNVLREFSQVGLVISPWPNRRSFDDRDCLPAEVGHRIVGVTRKTQIRQDKVPACLWAYVREAQAAVWMRENQPGKPWLSLEAQDWWFRPASPNLMLIDATTGITPADMEQLRRRLHAFAAAKEKKQQ